MPPLAKRGVLRRESVLERAFNGPLSASIRRDVGTSFEGLNALYGPQMRVSKSR